jgi:hypothetical protein
MTFKKKALRKSDFKKLVIFSFLLFSLFSPHLNLLGTQIKTVYFFIVMPGVFGALIVLKKMKMQTAEFYFLLAILVSLIYSVIISFIALAVDISQIVAALRGILLFFSGYFFVYIYRRSYKENFFDILLLHTVYAILLNSILIILLFLIPDFKSAWHNIVLLSETQSYMAMRNDADIRLSGLGHSGFGALSVVNAIGFLILLYLHLYATDKTVNLHKLIFCAAILFLATVVVGRLGFIVMIMSLGLLLVSINRKKIFFRYLKMLVLMSLSLGLVAITFYINFEEKFILGFLTIFDFFLKGTLDSSTSIVLAETFSPDLSFKDWMIGTGDFREETILRDSGYIRLITGGGFLGLLVIYMFMSVPIFVAIKRGFPHQFKVLLIVFPIIIFVINIKNVFYFAYNDIFQIYILIVISVFKLNVVRSIPDHINSLDTQKSG